MRPHKRIWLALAYVLVGYCFIFVARPVVLFFRDLNLLRVLVTLICLATFYLLYRLILNNSRSNHNFSLKWTFGLGAFYSVLLYFVERPEERMHFVQYGLLSPLLIFTLSPYLQRNKAIHHFLSFALSASFGVIDECIQYIAPDRIFEWRDIYMNVAAAFLGSLFSILILFHASKLQTNVSLSR